MCCEEQRRECWEVGAVESVVKRRTFKESRRAQDSVLCKVRMYITVRQLMRPLGDSLRTLD